MAHLWEHHFGKPSRTDYHDRNAPGEHWAFVSFPLDVNGMPQLREDLTAGSVITVEESPDGLEGH